MVDSSIPWRVQAFGELIAEVIGRSVMEPFRRPEPLHPWLAVIGYGISI